MNKILLSMVLGLLILPTIFAQSNLMMTDLEDIDLSGLSAKTIESGNLLFRVETYTDTLGMYGHPSPKIDQGERWIQVGDIIAYADLSSSDLLPTSFRIEFSLEASVQEGDFITLTYDGGQTLDVYLPIANVYDYFFIATDGSTYYDSDLTEIAMSKPSIIGPKIVELESTHSYLIDVSTNLPDSDFSDGTYQVQYASWGLMDSNGILIHEEVWEEVFGNYKKTATVTFPNEVGEYSLFTAITQIDMTFDEITGQWTSSEEYILVQEAVKINVQYSVTEPIVPTASGFSIFGDVWNWLKGLWNWVF